jgi:microsomal prostaglandin-E synthase 2
MRNWVDTVFVHLISPNVYRTPRESLDTFNWFSEAGDWGTNFSNFQKNTIIYIGAFVMYLVGKKLKKKLVQSLF